MSSMAFGAPLVPQFGSTSVFPNLNPNPLYSASPLFPSANLFQTNPAYGVVPSNYNPAPSSQSPWSQMAAGFKHVMGLGPGQVLGLNPAVVWTADQIPSSYLHNTPFGRGLYAAGTGVKTLDQLPASVAGPVVHFFTGSGGGTTTAKKPVATDPYTKLPTGGSTGGFGKGTGKVTPGTVGTQVDQSIVNKLTQVPQFNYTPISAGAGPPVLGYTPSLLPTGKGFWKSLPLYQSASGAERKILDQAFSKVTASANQDIGTLQAFAKAVQNLPSLAPQALAIAKGELGPQAQAAQQAGLRTANFIRLLGQAAAGIQNQVSANIGSSYTNAADTLRALGQAVGGTVGAGLQTGLSGAPGSPLAPSAVTTGGMTGVPAAAAGALSTIGGQLPAQSLANQAPLATAADSSLANIMMGGARQQSLMALAQGNQNVAQIMAQLPQYQQQALGQLTTERNANLDRQLQLLQASGQINASQRSAIMTLAGTEAQAVGTDIAGINQRNMAGWQQLQQNLSANVTAQNQAGQFNVGQRNQAAQAQAARVLQTQIANNNMALQVYNDKVAANQRSLSNYFSYLRTVYASNKTTQMKPPDFRKEATDLQGWANGVYSTNTVNVKDPTTGNQIPVRTLQRQKLPVDQAWRQFKTTYGPYYAQFGVQGMQAMFDAFKPYYPEIPNVWTIQNVERNYGPISVAADGRSHTSGPLQLFPAPAYILPNGTPYNPGV
jgi:hypothetical protein